MTEVSLHVQGMKYSGWTDITISRGIEQLASGFSLTITELWTARKEPIPIREGSQCELSTRDRTIIPGFIDSSSIKYDATSHTMSVEGRSYLGDLIDCAAVVKGGEFRNQTLEQIAEVICAPFGITVVSDRLVRKKFRKFGIQLGETCEEALNRAAKPEGALLTSNDRGQLFIPSGIRNKVSTVLERGVNVLSGGLTGVWSDRFSTYTVKSQTSGSKNTRGRVAAQISRTSTDKVIDRYRPMVMIAESQVDGKGARTRADWERNTRSGKSQRIVYTVRDWEEGDGIWTPGLTVAVLDNFLQIDEDLLIASVTLRKSEAGETTELELVKPEALDVLAEPLPKESKDSFW